MSNPSAVIPNHLSTKIPIPLSLSLSFSVSSNATTLETNVRRNDAHPTGHRAVFFFLAIVVPFFFLSSFFSTRKRAAEATQHRREEGEGEKRWKGGSCELGSEVRDAWSSRSWSRAGSWKPIDGIQNYFPVIESYRFIDMRFITISLYSFSCSRAFCLNRNRFKFYIYIYIYIFVRRSVWKIYIWYTYTIYCYAISIEKRRKIWYSLASLSRKKRESVLLRGVKVHV